MPPEPYRFAPLPAAPPASDPTTAFRYRDGLYAADLVAAAVVHFDLFTWLARRAATAGEIGREFGLVPRAVDVMLTLFVAAGFLARGRDGFGEETVRVLPVAREHLCSDSPWFLGPYYHSLKDRPTVADLVEALRTGLPAGWRAFEDESRDWHGAMEGESFARMFTAAMDCRGVYLGGILAERVPLEGRRRLLDVGGGSGVYACSFAMRTPGLSATVLEKPPVDDIAREAVAARGLGDRVTAEAGDLFAPWPQGFDVHLLSNVLHDWDLPEVGRILDQSAEALGSGGLLVIHDAFLNDEKSGPLPVAEYSVILMTVTRGRCYSVAEIRALLMARGFAGLRFTACGADRGVLTAVRT